MEKIIVVGAGFSGATIARLFAESGSDVIVIDKRETVGGNAYDYVDKNGILVQAHGRHVFHTNDQEVFEFLSRFTEWREYEHKVVARVRRDRYVPVPFNLNSLYLLYAKDKADRIKNVLIEELGEGKIVPILQLKKHPSEEIKKFADFVYKNIFYIHTMKQWGFKPEQLGSEVMNKVPVCLSTDDRYCADKYQFMPKNGFAEMISNILRHPKIHLKLKTDAKKEIAFVDGKIYYCGKPLDGKVIYTGSVDELFDYKYEQLPYRSLKLKFETKKTSSYQPAAVVNYTVSHPYTRISEFTKFTCEPKENTVIVKEYPKPYKKGKNVPYYPIPKEKNRKHYERYLEEARGYENLYLLGRLATYKNINMDVAVREAIDLFEEITE